MTSLLAGDFYLVEGDKVRATVEAMNEIDYSIVTVEAGEALI